jgi:hypothetical protein
MFDNLSAAAAKEYENAMILAYGKYFLNFVPANFFV